MLSTKSAIALPAPIQRASRDCWFLTLEVDLCAQLRPAVLDTYEAIAESAKKPTSSPVHLFPEGDEH